MANNGLIEIAEILKQLNDELKLDNDKWEQTQNGRSILPRSDAGIARTGNQTTGESE